jgi:hypothetical protein
MTGDFQLMPCGPEALLPAQVSEGVRWDADTSGPRALMLAVLEEAVRCIAAGRGQRRFRARRLAAEAEAWVRCDRVDWPFSFLNICELLGFDADAMRARLLTRHPSSRTRVRSPKRAWSVRLALRRSSDRCA